MIEPSGLRAVYWMSNVPAKVPVIAVMAVAVKVTVASVAPTLFNTVATAAVFVKAIPIRPPVVVGVIVPTSTPAIFTVITPPVNAEGALVCMKKMWLTMAPAGITAGAAVVVPTAKTGITPARRVAVIGAM